MTNNLCAVHPDVSATFTCTRCGSFACGVCQSTEPSLCVSCLQRGTEGLGSAGLEPIDTLKRSLEVVRNALSLVLPIALVQSVLTVLLTHAPGRLPSAAPVLGLAASCINLTLLMAFQTVWMSLFGASALRQPLLFGAIIRPALASTVFVAIASILEGLAVGLGFLLLIVPGVFLFLGLALTQASVVLGRRNPFDALRESWELTDGHRLNLFLMLLMLAVVTTPVSLVLGVLSVFSMRWLPPEVPALVTTFWSTLSQAVFTAVLAVAYLRRTRGLG